MRRTAFFLRALFAISVAAMLHNAYAAPVAGTDYAVLNTPQPVETGDKIEVREAFSYLCQHCHDFDPELSAWVKKFPADVELRRMPISFSRESWANLAKVYYTLEAMGEVEKLHAKVFDAIHGQQKLDLSKSEVLFDWVAKQGIDRKKFADTFNSFTVQTKATRIGQLTQNYGIDSVPTLIVDGKYRVTGGKSHQDKIRIASELIELARSQRPAKSAAAHPAAPASTEASKKAVK
ncbi:MAG: thiol:disulfide interchange protein DsbA/DsbL [Pseudomonadota bacterium]